MIEEQCHEILILYGLTYIDHYNHRRFNLGRGKTHWVAFDSHPNVVLFRYSRAINHIKFHLSELTLEIFTKHLEDLIRDYEIQSGS